MCGFGSKITQTASFFRENNTGRLQRHRRVSAPAGAGLRFPGHVRVSLRIASALDGALKFSELNKGIWGTSSRKQRGRGVDTFYLSLGHPKFPHVAAAAKHVWEPIAPGEAGDG